LQLGKQLCKVETRQASKAAKMHNLDGLADKRFKKDDRKTACTYTLKFERPLL